MVQQHLVFIQVVHYFNQQQYYLINFLLHIQMVIQHLLNNHSFLLQQIILVKLNNIFMPILNQILHFHFFLLHLLHLFLLQLQLLLNHHFLLIQLQHQQQQQQLVVLPIQLDKHNHIYLHYISLHFFLFQRE